MTGHQPKRVRCALCGTDPRACLYGGWVKLVAPPGLEGLRFVCPAFEAVVEARSKGDWRWRVASQRDNGQRRVIATGGGRSRLEAIRAVALALHQSGYFADQQPSELVAAMIVASNRTEDGQSSHG